MSCYFLIEFGVGFADSHHEGVVLLALGVENLEGAAFGGHDGRRAVCGQGQLLVDFGGEGCGLGGAVA